MVLSKFSQMTYRFTCPHCGHVEAIVLSRLDGVTEWKCEACPGLTDFRKEPHKSEIDQQRDTASESDKQARQRGQNVTPLD